MVMLKPLSAALRDRDPIRAVIAHSGVNQDGRTKGITLPNGAAQEELIRRVYSEANLDPADCGFAEAHGTGTCQSFHESPIRLTQYIGLGTKAGDPIEAAAIHAALGQGRTPRNPLYMGSVKSNVGHLEGKTSTFYLVCRH